MKKTRNLEKNIMFIFCIVIIWAIILTMPENLQNFSDFIIRLGPPLIATIMYLFSKSEYKIGTGKPMTESEIVPGTIFTLKPYKNISFNGEIYFIFIMEDDAEQIFLLKSENNYSNGKHIKSRITGKIEALPYVKLP